MDKGKFFLAKAKENEYSHELEKCIEDACQYCIDTTFVTNTEDKVNHPIMMLGKIQSGKTRAFTGLMALAFDNRFDMVFILTKNSVALVKQTYKRMRREFRSFINANEVEVFDIMNEPEGLTEYELDKKVIVVAKKEKRNLDKISDFISNYTIQQRKYCLIIDDEADTTGIGFSHVKGTDDEFDLRTVASKVNGIRGSLDGCVFVQVTATPYALYLQPDFSEEKIEPIKPKRTVLVPSGEGYVGGDYYFIKSKEEGHPASFIFEPVPPDEHIIVADQKRKGKKSKIEDRRTFKEEEILTGDKLGIFKTGLINFIVGGCILRIHNKTAHYAYVIHTATQKTSHDKLESITRVFLKQIKERNTKTTAIIDDMLDDAYEDLKRSVCAYGFEMPNIDDVKKEFYHVIDKDYICISIVNSDKDIDSILNEDTGELRLRTPFSIFVGGQVLDRGVTIPNMIGFYYGRNPRTMQQDTVLQHSRMFGYRSKELLSVTRFYTTTRINDNMTKITEMDTALREDIENGNFSEGIYFIQRFLTEKTDENGNKIKDQIIPCSPVKIALSNIVLLKPGRRILPIGFMPKAKSYTAKSFEKINKVIAAYMNTGELKAVPVPLEAAEELAALVYETFDKDDESMRFVSLDHFIDTMRYLASGNKTVQLIVRREREITKYYNNGTYQDAPYNAKGPLSESVVANNSAINDPALILIHEKGNSDEWENRQFWWPILVVPQNAKRTVFAMPDSDGYIRNI